ncbi:hypothetical protein, partial [Stenotrophomonas maltophilia]|uniref:hypothetical protein n=1 Tax=Stenotrophomonas maltophilia TaxID=40324 RepID=UPI003BF926FE
IPTLSWPHLIALGSGAILGTGIYTLIGVGANLAGTSHPVDTGNAGQRPALPQGGQPPCFAA